MFALFIYFGQAIKRASAAALDFSDFYLWTIDPFEKGLTWLGQAHLHSMIGIIQSYTGCAHKAPGILGAILEFCQLQEGPQLHWIFYFCKKVYRKYGIMLRSNKTGWGIDWVWFSYSFLLYVWKYFTHDIQLITTKSTKKHSCK